jgi:GTP cyclohydrolase I
VIEYQDLNLYNFVEKRYWEKFASSTHFRDVWSEYVELKPFKISDNVEVVGGISEECHYVMRLVTQYYMEKVFHAMKIDMADDNVAGDKGTPYRWVKMYCGNDLEDDTELLSGRWANKPRIASFINTNAQKFPITKRIDIVSNCSHHTAPFSTMFREDSYAIVSYIPEDKILGISKLQRIVDWVSRRGHLQEGLTQMIYDAVCEISETKSVYVKLSNIVHTCEKLRGSQSDDGSFTSEYYGGAFEDPELRKQVQKG